MTEASLTSVAKLKQLQCLHLNRCDKAFNNLDLWNIVSLQQLEHLRIHISAYITDHGLSIISSLQHYCDNITDAGLGSVLSLQHLCNSFGLRVATGSQEASVALLVRQELLSRELQSDLLLCTR